MNNITHDLKLIGWNIIGSPQHSFSCPYCGIGYMDAPKAIACMNTYHNFNLGKHWEYYSETGSLGNIYHYARLIDKPLEKTKQLTPQQELDVVRDMIDSNFSPKVVKKIVLSIKETTSKVKKHRKARK